MRTRDLLHVKVVPYKDVVTREIVGYAELSIEELRDEEDFELHLPLEKESVIMPHPEKESDS